MHQILHSILTFVVLIAAAVCMSEDRKSIHKKDLVRGVICHIIFALVMFKVPAVVDALCAVNRGLRSVAESTTKGVSIVFGGLASPETSGKLGFIMALQSLPLLIVISALSSLLIYLRILPCFIRMLSYLFQKTLRIGGTLGVAVSTNIFAGMSETPLVITPYLRHLSHSELFTLMVCGTAGLASSVVVLLDLIIQPVIPNAIVHIISSVLIGIPMAITVSKIMVPEKNQKLTEANDRDLHKSSSFIDAIFTGIMNGAKVMVTIVCMLIGFVALIDILNKLLALFPDVMGKPLSLQLILGLVMTPISWLIGIPSHEVIQAGSIIGSKIAFNEVIAFQEFAAAGGALSEPTRLILLYALAGFANFGSIGLMVGVYTMLVPERRDEVIRLGIRSIVAGNIVGFLNAALAAVFLN